MMPVEIEPQPRIDTLVRVPGGEEYAVPPSAAG